MGELDHKQIKHDTMSIVMGALRQRQSWVGGSDEGLFCSQWSSKVLEVMAFEQKEGEGEQAKWISRESGV